MKKRGIDVSTFQGQINWSNVKTSGIEFAMIRSGYGRGELDERFIQNYFGAKAVGLPIGVYHYSYANTVARAKQEAEFVVSYLKGKQFEYPIAFDVEDATLQKLSKRNLSAIVDAFCKTVESNGYYVIIYSSKSWLLNKLDMKVLSRYDVWCAQWNHVCDYPYPYGMWQYSDKGAVAGITGRVDLDYAYKDYPKIIKSAKLNGYGDFVPTTPTPPKKTLKKGSNFVLTHTRLYASSTTAKVSGYISGRYYLYDGKCINGRYRITNLYSNCGETPMSKYVTGWINEGDIK